MSPLVSVVVPSYNHEKFLKERLDSIINQTFQDFELIILDDLSPDNSRDIIESYRTHPKVSNIVYNEINSGSTFFQWNKAVLELAKGEFIWIAESDDVAEITFLEKLVPVLENDPKIVLAYSQSARMDSEGNITGSWNDWTNDLKGCEVFDKSFQTSGRNYIQKFLINKNTIPNASAVVFRKDKYIETEGAEVMLKINGDWELWLKILLLGDIYFSNETLNKFRYHLTSVIAKAKNGNLTIEKKYYLIEQRVLMRESFRNRLKDKRFSDSQINLLNNRKIFIDKLKSRIVSIYIFFKK